MTLEEHIASIFQKTYDGCDTALLENNPRAYGLGWVRVGFYAGMEAGLKMKGEIDEFGAFNKTQLDYNRGYAQGISYAVWVAGTQAEDDSPIMRALKAARDVARQRIVQ